MCETPHARDRGSLLACASATPRRSASVGPRLAHARVRPAIAAVRLHGKPLNSNTSAVRTSLGALIELKGADEPVEFGAPSRVVGPSSNQDYPFASRGNQEVHAADLRGRRILRFKEQQTRRLPRDDKIVAPADKPEVLSRRPRVVQVFIGGFFSRTCATEYQLHVDAHLGCRDVGSALSDPRGALERGLVGVVTSNRSPAVRRLNS